MLAVAGGGSSKLACAVLVAPVVCAPASCTGAVSLTGEDV
jgi:hypothetical protein